MAQEHTLKIEGTLRSYHSGNLYAPITNLPISEELIFTQQVIQHDTLAAGSGFVTVDQGNLDPAKGVYLSLDQSVSVRINGEAFAATTFLVFMGEIELLEISKHATEEVNFHAEFYA